VVSSGSRSRGRSARPGGPLIADAIPRRWASAKRFQCHVLFIAVAMLGWHNVWMTRHRREMAANLKSSASGAPGDKPLYALSIVSRWAVFREGSELVLFL